MRKIDLQIRKTTMIALDTVEMVLKNEYASQTAGPGQFLHISVPGHTLRRPISIADVDKEAGTITILFKKFGRGTKLLADYHPGMTLNALGPSGNGFSPDQAAGSTALLIGGGIGVPPLYYLGKTLKEKNVNVIAVLGFQTAIQVFYEKAFQALGETYVVTDDGTYGQAGFVTDVLDQVSDFDHYYTCGPVPMLKSIQQKLAGRPGTLSLEERMGCGVGACFACVIPCEEGGYRKVCQNGPVFRTEEIAL